ncbi:MAG: hypothetical protein HY913_11175 [Desulfomonile tiedjei]|nr:hypothetical protein [Desulfomonile tiedjei]
MPARSSKRLVVDADILLSAGGEKATHPRAISSRDFLKAIRRICHKVVTTPEIAAEWYKKPTKKRKSRRLQAFASTWLTSMHAKKKIIFLNPPRKTSLRNKAKRLVAKKGDLETLLNDMHLIEAASSADTIVVSYDEAARKLFHQAASNLGELRNIAWVNPENEAEEPIKWLEAGAPKDQSRLLGSNP